MRSGAGHRTINSRCDTALENLHFQVFFWKFQDACVKKNHRTINSRYDTAVENLRIQVFSEKSVLHDWKKLHLQGNEKLNRVSLILPDVSVWPGDWCQKASRRLGEVNGGQAKAYGLCDNSMARIERFQWTIETGLPGEQDREEHENRER